MMRDYAKRGANKNKKKKKISRLGSWVMVIFLFTVFTLSLVFFGKHKSSNNVKDQITQVSAEHVDLDKSQNKKIEKNKEKVKNKEKIKQKNKDLKNSGSKDASEAIEETKVASEEMPPPKFDFYTILPEKNDSKPMTGYEIEIVVTKDLAGAESLKTQLGLLGLVAEIITIQKKDSKPKYRVSIGPYDNKPAAATDLEKIQQGKISGKIKKIY